MPPAASPPCVDVSVTPGLSPDQVLVRADGQYSFGEQARDYRRVAAALAYLDDHFAERPSLSDLAAEAGLSEYHFQRLFSRWVGISPKRFLQYLTLEAAKASLARSSSVLDAAFDAGLSGPGRLHDLFVTWEAASPGEYKSGGRGLRIRYGYHPSPFGECLLLLSDRGICGLGFVVDGDRADALAHLAAPWSNALLVPDEAATDAVVAEVFAPTAARQDAAPIRLLLRGTPFQLKVWEALLAVPPGRLTTYEDIARQVGYAPGAARAIGSANGANLISWLIPCHRVIRKSGVIGGYRWGRARKLAMIGWEASRAVCE